MKNAYAEKWGPVILCGWKKKWREEREEKDKNQAVLLYDK